MRSASGFTILQTKPANLCEVHQSFALEFATAPISVSRQFGREFSYRENVGRVRPNRRQDSHIGTRSHPNVRPRIANYDWARHEKSRNTLNNNTRNLTAEAFERFRQFLAALLSYFHKFAAQLFTCHFYTLELIEFVRESIVPNNVSQPSREIIALRMEFERCWIHLFQLIGEFEYRCCKDAQWLLEFSEEMKSLLNWDRRRYEQGFVSVDRFLLSLFSSARGREC